MSTAEAKKKADEMVAMDMHLERRFDSRKPTGPRDPNFDRTAAIEKLSAWSVHVISILEELYDSFQDITNELDLSPDLYDLFRSPSSVYQIRLKLSDLVCQSYDCVPKLLKLPTPV
jgi:hypothetical protein